MPDRGRQPGESGDRPRSGDLPGIVLVQNPWTASALNAEVAKILIEENLGNTVEITAIDENTMFAGLAAGDLDACLEVWPSGVTAEEQAYLDEGSVVQVGPLGAVGQIGWYVPRYVQEQFPETATWEGFLDPEVASQFASAETGDLGRFLGTDPSFSQYDEAIIENLGLPLQVVFSGSEAATVAALDSAVSAEEPILMYWWVPTAAAAKYDLVPVELPEYTDECYADPAEIACAYPEDVLVKIAGAHLADKDPAVSNFLAWFTQTNDDQSSMLPAVEIDGEPAAEVAAQWVADNEDTWTPWLSGDPPPAAPATTSGTQRPRPRRRPPPAPERQRWRRHPRRCRTRRPNSVHWIDTVAAEVWGVPRAVGRACAGDLALPRRQGGWRHPDRGDGRPAQEHGVPAALDVAGTWRRDADRRRLPHRTIADGNRRPAGTQRNGLIALATPLLEGLVGERRRRRALGARSGHHPVPRPGQRRR